MFEWLFGDKYKRLEDKTQKGFESVKKDMDVVGKWIKHLEGKDKQVFDQLTELKWELSSLRDEIVSIREGVGLHAEDFEQQENQQVSKKLPVLGKQTSVEDVVNAVQTGVQTGSFHGILKGLSANERLLVFTLSNSDMKLSYEDLALLLGKERSTIRGQINSIKQKREGLIMEISERNGKKRVFVPEEIHEKLAKYAKVRVSSGKKSKKKVKNG
jgi:biotin operon repressor